MINGSLKGKKILFISVSTFNLEVEIKNKLESLGAIVTYFNERPNNSNMTKAIIRVKKSIYKNKITNYYKTIISEIDGKDFDYLFVNKGEVVPVFFLEYFIEKFPSVKRIFYCWDSFANNPNALNIIKYFDQKSTFDPVDSVTYGLNFRPLFFLDEYKGLKKGKESLDLLFLGTAHSDRYVISDKIKDWCIKNGLSAFCFYYMQGKFVYFYKKYFDKTFKQFDYKKLSFISLNKKQILEYYEKSKVILDINHPNQKGLTLRTFETLGAGKKLMTTNMEIKKFPFYNENNVNVIDRANLDIQKSFFETPYLEVDNSIYEKFSLDGFLYNIFINPENDYWKSCL